MVNSVTAKAIPLMALPVHIVGLDSLGPPEDMMLRTYHEIPHGLGCWVGSVVLPGAMLTVGCLLPMVGQSNPSFPRKTRCLDDLNHRFSYIKKLFIKCCIQIHNQVRVGIYLPPNQTFVVLQ